MSMFNMIIIMAYYGNENHDRHDDQHNTIIINIIIIMAIICITINVSIIIIMLSFLAVEVWHGSPCSGGERRPEHAGRGLLPCRNQTW